MIVVADGIEYRGILVEIGIDEITLSTEERWISIPHSKISSVTDANETPSFECKDPSFAEIWDEKFDPSSSK